ncbi:MAG: 2,4-diaminopentanoate dehydrogenase [Chloroflexi bacterium]|nr:2,4-diaminopentanoate dehydrogenase [Chloroflexota bacterium]
MSENIRVIQYGLGPIGNATARYIVERAGLELVGGVDIDPAKVGKDVGKVIGLERDLDFAVTENLAQIKVTADVVLHATSSYFDQFEDQIIEILEAGLDVVSTAEELSFPWLAHPQQAAEIDAVAKRVGKTVLGTGVNPGFIMDSFPLNLTAICQQVEGIDVTRRINASTRRGPFQAKIGSGMTVDDFNARIAAGRMGHVGLPESMGMVLDTLGKRLIRYDSDIEPVVADHLITTDYFEVQPGQVQGLRQVGRAYVNGGNDQETDPREFLTLTFIAALELENEGDIIQIFGSPNLEANLKGTNGDIATVAIAVNSIRRVKEAAPGLVTMRDLPIVTFW